MMRYDAEQNIEIALWQAVNSQLYARHSLFVTLNCHFHRHQNFNAAFSTTTVSTIIAHLLHTLAVAILEKGHSGKG